MTSEIPTTLRMASEISDQPHDTGSAGPGRTIRQARERARLSLEELAKETRLARATLEALERDDFSTLTEPVYVRGYYRKCAKVLNLPENELISSYDKLFAPRTPTIPTKLLLSNSDTMSPTGRRGGSRGMLATVVVVAVLTAGIWFVTHDPSRFGFGEAPAAGSAEAAAVSAPAPTPLVLPPPSPIDPAAVTATLDASSTTSASTTTPAATPGEAAAPAASLNLDATLNPPTSTSTAATAAAPASAPPPAPVAVSTLTPSTTLAAPAVPVTAPATVPAATPTTATLPASGALVLSFKSSSWVRIEDADGRLLLSGTIQAGDRQQLSGRAPYALFLGYAPGVSVEFNGKPIDTTPFVRQNSTARISVPLPPNPVPATATQ